MLLLLHSYCKDRHRKKAALRALLTIQLVVSPRSPMPVEPKPSRTAHWVRSLVAAGWEMGIQ